MVNLIQGSVSQQGDRLRVTTGMTRAKDGTVVWSHSYDERLKDVFAIQPRIGTAVASALKIKLLGQTLGVVDKPPSGNVEAYQLMLQGRDIARRASTIKNRRQGIALYQQALKRDPNYAYVWRLLSIPLVNTEAYTQARVAANKAQILAPDAAMTYLARGYLLQTIDETGGPPVENDLNGALVEYKRAYAQAPHNATVMAFLGSLLQALGQAQATVNLYRKAIVTDPQRADLYFGLGYGLLGLQQVDAAEQAFHKVLALQPDYPGMNMMLAEAAVQRGDAAAIVRYVNKIKNWPGGKAWFLTAAAQLGPDRKKADAALHEYVAKYGKTEPGYVAEMYGWLKQPNNMFKWLQRAQKQHDPDLAHSLLVDCFFRPYKHDPRYIALLKELNLTPTDEPLSADAVPASATTQ